MPKKNTAQDKPHSPEALISKEIATIMSRLNPIESAPTDIDESDHARASADRELSLATRSLLVSRVNRLTAALSRVRLGIYGVCGECEEPIAPARLKLMPEVTLCRNCQEMKEQANRLSGREPNTYEEE